MPDNMVDHLKGWRRSAEDALAEANSVADPQVRIILLDIAAGYQRLVQQGTLVLGDKNSNKPYRNLRP
jgi:hypothetical protein